MPKGAPGQSRKPGGGRKPKQPGRQYERITVRISREAAKFINASGNASETIEIQRLRLSSQAAIAAMQCYRQYGCLICMLA